MKKALKILSLITITFVMLSCGGNEGVKRKSFDGVFEIDIPRFLKEADLENPDAIMQYGNIIQGLYAMMIYESVDELQAADLDFTIASYADFNLKNIMDSFEHPKASKVKTITSVNGAECVSYKIWGLFPEINEEMFYYLTIFKTDLNFYSFHTWTMASQESKHINTMEKMITSFKEL